MICVGFVHFSLLFECKFESCKDKEIINDRRLKHNDFSIFITYSYRIFKFSEPIFLFSLKYVLLLLSNRNFAFGNPVLKSAPTLDGSIQNLFQISKACSWNRLWEQFFHRLSCNQNTFQ